MKEKSELISMEISQNQNSPPQSKTQSNCDISHGNVCVMTHSFFSDVIRIACTPIEPKKYAEHLSASTPGDYKLIFSLRCDDPCKVKKQIKTYLHAKVYSRDFYQVSPKVAQKLLTQESLRIPASVFK